MDQQSFLYRDYIQQKNSTKKHRVKLFIFLVAVMLFSLFFLYSIFSLKKQALTDHIVSPLKDPVGTSYGAVEAIQKTPLDDIVKQSLIGTTGTYALVIKNLKTHEVYMQNEHMPFEPASLYKLWVMATVYELKEQGKLSEDDVLDDNVENLNDQFQIATDSAELTEGSFQMTVKQALEQMITVSHNYAALLLAQKVKNSGIANFLLENGFNESNLGNPPQTTPADIALFYEKLYNGSLVSKEASQDMMHILNNQQLNDRIPKYLPKEVYIAHKTGEIDEYKHDVGIVFTKKGDYIFVALSKSDFPQGAAERIAHVSRAVYEYFENRE